MAICGRYMLRLGSPPDGVCYTDQSTSLLLPFTASFLGLWSASSEMQLDEWGK